MTDSPAPRAVAYAWRGELTNPEINGLHAAAFEHPVDDGWDWLAQLERYSLGWVTARDDGGELIGFVNVVWDGSVHAFMLDTATATAARHRGIGTTLVRMAAEQARAAGCEWLHVDFDEHLRGFYFEACGFTPTDAGLIRLDD
ncbi:MAG TPA: GNAT family N-acetyltransferase [Micromonosporaceae bacterium]